jgi:signal transduction histidine kinase
VLTRLSVRARTTLAATVVVGLALAFGVAALLLVLRHSLVAGIDAGIRIRAGVVADSLRRGSPPTALPTADSESALVQVLDPAGRVVWASPNVEGESVLISSPPSADGRIRTASGLPVGEGGRFRVLAEPIDTPGGRETIVVAASLASVDRSVALVGGALALGAPALLAVVALMTWVSAGRALSPVEEIRAQVAEISMQDLDRRVLEPAATDEVGRLARTMNQMLDRLRASAVRQRQFVSDASHELRSPLAGMRAELEVALADREHADWPVTAGEVLEDVNRLQRLVDQLLVLARADEGAPLRSGPVDLDELVLREARRVRERGGLPVDVRAVSGARVRGDADRLRQVVRNLIDNAALHARSGVTVGLQADGPTAVLTVADDGPGIAPADRERIFERFTRLDEARAADRGGHGLGLAIVKEIVVAHGGTIGVEDAPVGARLVVRLPLDETS